METWNINIEKNCDIEKKDNLSKEYFWITYNPKLNNESYENFLDRISAEMVLIDLENKIEISFLEEKILLELNQLIELSENQKKMLPSLILWLFIEAKISKKEIKLDDFKYYLSNINSLFWNFPDFKVEVGLIENNPIELRYENSK